MAENQKKINDLNELFSNQTLSEIPVGKCMTTPDGQIQACKTNQNEVTIETKGDRFRWKAKINL